MPGAIKLPIDTPSYAPIRVKIANHILNALIVGSAVTALLTSPFGLYYLVRGGVRYYFRRSDFHREIKRLQKRKYIALTKTPEGWLVRLLKKGKGRKKILEARDVVLTSKKPWDRKWRLLVFDVPEKQRLGRDLLRRKLKELGLYNIQRSVFVYPYDCRKELEFITESYGMSRYTCYAEVSYIDIDKELRRYFKKIL